MQRFIAPSARPNATATRRSRAGRPRSRGRQIATGIRAAKARRPNAAPAGPSSSNSSTANAAPRRSQRLAIAQLAQRRAVPDALTYLAVRPPAGRLVDAARAQVALLRPQRRLAAARVAQRCLGGREQHAAGAAPPHARVGVEEVELAAVEHGEADDALGVLRDQLA